MSTILTTDSILFNDVTHSTYGLQCEEQTPRSSSSECSSKTSSRLASVLLDYKQFLAARTIQRCVRSWIFRVTSRRRNQAATTISRWWRGFNVRNKRYAVIEAELQARNIKHYHDMATKVQSLFRGWYSRMKCQDFQGMQQLRMQYVEDMLSTLVKCLHQAKKDHFLPGIYNLRETALLNKIEGVSLTFGYRFHNGRMRAAIAQRRAMLAKRRAEFRKTTLFTPAPYPEPGTVLLEEPDFCMTKTIGTQQQRVFLVYDKSIRDRHVRDVLEKVSARLRNNRAMHRKDIRHRFCKDLIRRTLRVSLKVPSHKRQSEMIQKFVEDLMDKVDEYNCNCRPKDLDHLWCT